jgi:hypothetical protein
MAEQQPHSQKVIGAIEATLTRELGAMIGGGRLTKTLGYPSQAAFRQALKRNRLPVPVFEVYGRRGKFALAKDVAIWLYIVSKERRQTRHYRRTDLREEVE